MILALAGRPKQNIKISGKKKKGPKKTPEGEFGIASLDVFWDYHVAAVTPRQSPFRPVVMFFHIRVSKAEAGQSFPFGQKRSCWAQILGKKSFLCIRCTCVPLKSLGLDGQPSVHLGKALQGRNLEPSSLNPLSSLYISVML